MVHTAHIVTCLAKHPLSCTLFYNMCLELAERRSGLSLNDYASRIRFRILILASLRNHNFQLSTN